MALATVFGIHRWIAGGFGVCLLGSPAAMGQLFSPSQSLAQGEVLALRSWGCFILAVAGIAHSAPAFPIAAQRAVGRSLAGCFGLLTVVYAHGVLAADGAQRSGVAATGATFAALFVAYAWALRQDSGGADGDKAR
jgi:hypothetical protein